MKINEKRIDILTQAYYGRQDSVMHHQINIDNYRLAITEIDSNHGEDMLPFRNQLEKLLTDSLHEQKKEMIMLTVIEKQLKD